jgi:uncharacterized protein (UPF0335 family)
MIDAERKAIKSFADRIKDRDAEIKLLNDDKRDIYAEAKAKGVNVKLLKAAIVYTNKPRTERERHESEVAEYVAIIEGGTVHAPTRTHAREAMIEPRAATASSNAPAIVTSQPLTHTHDDGLDIPDYLKRERVQA